MAMFQSKLSYATWQEIQLQRGQLDMYTAHVSSSGSIGYSPIGGEVICKIKKAVIAWREASEAGNLHTCMIYAHRKATRQDEHVQQSIAFANCQSSMSG